MPVTKLAENNSKTSSGFSVEVLEYAFFYKQLYF